MRLEAAASTILGALEVGETGILPLPPHAHSKTTKRPRGTGRTFAAI
jgi:hypothetical protein